jgi:PhnB protein
MATKVKPIPDGYHAVTPALVVRDAARAMEFYKAAFGAQERMRMAGPGGKIVHAEMTIGDSVIMVADEFPEWGNLSPESLKGSPVRMGLYVEDVDAVANRAVAAGAKVLIPVADQFYGDRSGRLADPFGHIWIISTHKEDVSPEEMQNRMDAFSKKQSGA